MSEPQIQPWRRKPGYPRRYSIMDGEKKCGTIFVSHDVYTVLSSTGYLLGAFLSLDEAAQALAGPSS